MQPVFDARGHDAHHAFVKILAKHADARRAACRSLRHRSSAAPRPARACRLLNLARSRLMRSRSCGQLQGVCIVGQQAFNANRHVGQVPGGVDARAPGQSPCHKWWPAARFCLLAWYSAAHACWHGAFAYALQHPGATRRRLLASSLTTSATVPSATSGSRVSSRGWFCASNCAALAQLGAQHQQYVEHHAHPSQVFPGKACSRAGWG